MSEKSLYLIDASSLFFRSYYALPPLKTSKGFPTHALYGFASMIFKLLKNEKPNYIACCFDRNEPSFRSDIFPDYKMNRSETPEDLSVQIPYIHDFISYLGLPCFDRKLYEADDVIGSLTEFGKRQGLKVVIVSGDKDFVQLVDSNVLILDTMKDVLYTEKEIKEKWGIEPYQMVDYLSIVGDSSDNIPGILGIGKKGAQKLLGEFKTLDTLYEKIESLPNQKLRQKLVQGKESAYLSRKLVRIVLNLDFKLSLSHLEPKEIDEKAIFGLFNELELHSLLKHLKHHPLENTSENKRGKEGKEIEKSENQKMFLSSLDQKKNSLIHGGMQKGERGASYRGDQKNKIFKEKIPKKVKKIVFNRERLKKEIKPYSSLWVFFFNQELYLGSKENLIQLDIDLEKEDLNFFFIEKFIRWRGFDLKKIFRKLGLKEVLSPEMDLMIAAYLLKSDLLKLSYEEMYARLNSLEEVSFGSPEEFYLSYLNLEKILVQRLQELDSKKLEELFYTVELPLMGVLHQMEQTGIGIAKNVLEQQSKIISLEIKEYEEKIYKEAGIQFNISSPKQLSHILFSKMGLPHGKKTKTGYSTDARILKKLSHFHPMVKDVLEYRECIKLKSTYIDSLLGLQNKKTQRVHTYFHQTATSTGRLSSTQPNLQNIPIRTKRGQEVRGVFQSQSNHFLICADYNQIELRVLAELTSDSALIQAFAEDQDIHKATAVEIYNLKHPDQVTPDLRRLAKTVNFGILYGQGAYGLSESLNVSFEEASSIIERYMNRFKKVREYIFDTLEFAQRHGYVETLFGRRRYIEELQSKSHTVKKFGERAAINAPIQGTASDIVKKSMVSLYNETSASLLIQVHDELLFECPRTDLDFNLKIIKEIMENIIPLKVQLKVAIGWGENWNEAHT